MERKGNTREREKVKRIGGKKGKKGKGREKRGMEKKVKIKENEKK